MIVVNGRRLAAGEVAIDPADRGLLLGDGLFETMPVFGGVAFRLEDHLARLERGCAVLGMPAERARWAETVALLAANADSAGGVVRLTVTRGPGPRGVKPPAEPRPTVIGTLAPWSPAIVFQPVRLATVGIPRNERSPLSRLKTLSYLEAVLGLAEAEAGGATEPLFLNTADRVACTAMANVFAVFADRIVTPPVEAGVLPGIARALVLGAGSIAGRPVVEADLAPTDLGGAEALFLTNSVRFVLPVAALDGRPFSDHAVARAVLDLMATAVEADCGLDPLARAQRAT